MLNQSKRFFKQRVLFPVLSLFPSLASAGIGSLFGGGDTVSDYLSGLINFLTSKPAKLIFILSIISIGYGTLKLGKIPKDKGIASVIGIGMVFGAPYFAQKLGIG